MIIFEWLGWLVPQFHVPTWERGAIVLLLILIGFFFQKYVLAKFIRWVGKVFVTYHKPLVGRLINEFEKAIRYAFFTAIVFAALSLLLEVSLFDNERTKDIFISLTLLFIFKGIFDVLTYFGKHPKSFRLFQKDDEIIKPYIIRLLKVLTVVAFVFLIASFWNFNLNGFLTGIGLTGVAVAFSVRETLSHIVSGMAIALDKPFQIGDWVTTEDEKIEGKVQDINLRSTLIQTFDKGLVYVPNSYFVNKPIFNLEDRSERKCEFTTYLAITNKEESIRNVCTSLQEQISLHPTIDDNQIIVVIDELNMHSFRLFVKFTVSTNDYSVLMEVKQDILFALHEILLKNEVKLAEIQEKIMVK